MKKLITFLFVTIISLTSTITSFATPITNAPFLENIIFENAEIEGGFDSNKTNYNLILQNPNESPKITDYNINGNADVFITYNYDESNHQTGLVFTLGFENGSVIYNFNYKNVADYKQNDNANLADIGCKYGEVMPSFNDSQTNYKLYIPKDLTSLSIAPITQDVNAYCAPINIELNDKQEPDIKLTVTASNGDTKTYKFKVKRLNKTVAQVDNEMKNQGFESFVDGELFYQKPVFSVALFSSLAGIVVLILLSLTTKRIIISPYDKDEKPFYKSKS